VSDPRRQQRPIFRFFDRDPDRHRPLDGDYVQVRPVRLHRPGPWRTALVVALAIASAWVALTAVLAVLTAQGGTRLVVLVVVAVPVAAAWWLTSRVLTTGVYVHDRGLRQSRVLSVTEVDWPAVIDVRRVPEQVPLLGLWPRVDGERLVLVLADGTDLPTTVTTRSADFLGRAEAYDIAALALDRWWQASR
jgi:hypothetical protein